MNAEFAPLFRLSRAERLELVASNDTLWKDGVSHNFPRAPVRSLFAGETPSPGEEVISTLLQAGQFRLERIISNAAASPPGFWYDQPHDEWVILLRGSAVLALETGETLNLQPGDYLLIQRHTKHRIESTSPDAIWLTLHYDNGQSPS